MKRALIWVIVPVTLAIVSSMAASKLASPGHAPYANVIAGSSVAVWYAFWFRREARRRKRT
jgi:4-amino-4-deoxy-L-arabinose transferase-like glycosyltransferase